MFDISSLSNNGQGGSITMILLTFAATLALTIILVFTYDKTTKPMAKPNHFIQSLFLMALVTATIMQSIGDSLALSFGIFGALAIIRFRTRTTDPRDVSFVFAAMSIGIGCGVHSFLNVAIGTLIFCTVVFMLFISPFHKQMAMVGNLRLTGNGDQKKFETLAAKYTNDLVLQRIRVVSAEDGTSEEEYDYRFTLNAQSNHRDMHQAILQLNDFKLSRFTFEEIKESDPII